MSRGQDASAVAEPTEICLSEMKKIVIHLLNLVKARTNFRRSKDKPANVIIILGEMGAGKSSLLEYLTGASGHSEEAADSVTKRFQIEKSNINGKEYYIMDTPGFDHGTERQLLVEVANGIRNFDGKARIVGILLVIPMYHTRVNDMHRKLLRFTLALCGNEYIPQVTVVTTFWEASKEQQAKYNARHANLLVEVGKVWSAPGRINHYKHGRKYEDGEDTGVYLKWYEDREAIAEYAKDMIHRRYGDNNPQDPRIIRELGPGPDLTRTTAGQFLGMTPTSSPGSTFGSASSASDAPRSEEEFAQNHEQDIPKQEPPTEDRPEDTPPKPSPCSDGAFRQGTNAQTNEKGWWDYVLEAVVAFASNINVLVSVDSNGGSASAGLGFSNGPGGGSRTHTPRAGHYNGPLDPLSVVDKFKGRGLDSSPENRARVGRKLGVTGTPGSAAFNDELRRKL